MKPCGEIGAFLASPSISSMSDSTASRSEKLSKKKFLKSYLSTSWIIFGHSWRVIVAGMPRLVMLEASGYCWNVKHFKYPGNSATQARSPTEPYHHVIETNKKDRLI